MVKLTDEQRDLILIGLCVVIAGAVLWTTVSTVQTNEKMLDELRLATAKLPVVTE